jgi:hypothetical protein
MPDPAGWKLKILCEAILCQIVNKWGQTPISPNQRNPAFTGCKKGEVGMEERGRGNPFIQDIGYRVLDQW